MSIFPSSSERYVYAKFPSTLHPFLKNVFTDKIHLTKKMFNFSLNQFETAIKRSSLISYPYSIIIDPVNICNLKCPLCPTWQDSQARPKGKMNLTMFQRILDEIGPYLFALNLCNWGEPFLNPALPDMIKYAKKFNMVVGISTNLNYLPDGTAERIIDSGIDIIVLSIDGISQESYSKYRRGGNLEKVLSNIEKLNSCRKYSVKSPLLIWQFLVNRYNESEIDIARQRAEKMGLQFYPAPMRTAMGKELLLPLYARVKEMKDWLPENPAYNKYAYEIKHTTRTKQSTCKWLWNSMVVNWDSSISPCCGVFEKKWDFTACHDNANGKPLTLHQAWNSPRYKLARRLVSAHIKKSRDLNPLVKQYEKEGLICVNCIHYGFLED